MKYLILTVSFFRGFLPNFLNILIPLSLKRKIIEELNKDFLNLQSAASKIGDYGMAVDTFKSQAWQSREMAFNYKRNVNDKKYSGDALLGTSMDIILEKILKSDMKILDIGSGTGAVTKPLLKKQFNVFSTDISREMLVHARNEVGRKSGNFFVSDGKKLSIHDETFDAVVSRMFLMHFFDWKSVLREISRITKRKGFIVTHFTSAKNLDLGLTSTGDNIYPINSFPFASNNSKIEPSEMLNYATIVDEDELQSEFINLNLKYIDSYPVTFFNHNSLFKCFDNYSFQAQFDEYLKNKKVYEFLKWFEKNLIESKNTSLSLWRIMILQKL